MRVGNVTCTVLDMHASIPMRQQRFHWLAEMMTGGQKVANSLHILMNWLKQGDDWKLLSRSATKL